MKVEVKDGMIFVYNSNGFALFVLIPSELMELMPQLQKALNEVVKP